MKDNKLKPFKAIGAGVKGSVAARNLRDERQEMGEGGLAGFGHRFVTKLDQFAGVEGSDEASLKQNKLEKLGQELYAKNGEFAIDKNGNLVEENGEYIKKDKNAKFDIIHDEEARKKWQAIEAFKQKFYDYSNGAEDVEREIKEHGGYNFTYQDESGTQRTKFYSSMLDFNADKAKVTQSYNKLKDSLNKELNLSKNSGDKRRYEAYTSFADSIEAPTKLRSSDAKVDIGTAYNFSDTDSNQTNYDDDFKRRFNINDDKK